VPPASVSGIAGKARRVESTIDPMADWSILNITKNKLQNFHWSTRGSRDHSDSQRGARAEDPQKLTNEGFVFCFL
jgi:hypothetical protein